MMRYVLATLNLPNLIIFNGQGIGSGDHIGVYIYRDNLIERDCSVHQVQVAPLVKHLLENYNPWKSSELTKMIIYWRKIAISSSFSIQILFYKKKGTFCLSYSSIQIFVKTFFLNEKSYFSCFPGNIVMFLSICKEISRQCYFCSSIQERKVKLCFYVFQFFTNLSFSFHQFKFHFIKSFFISPN